MLVHVTRSSFPSTIDDFYDQLENDGTTNLEMILDGTGFDGWSLPASAMTGHPVWFQISAGSVSNARSLVRQASEDEDEWAVSYLSALLPKINRVAGSLVAVGRVSGDPFRSMPVDSHFRGRIYAPVEQVTPLPNPVPVTSGSALSQLSPFDHTAARRTNRLVGGDREYTEMLRVVARAGNTVPRWAKVKINARSGDWWTTANDSDSSWLSESQLADQFAVPFCREISDQRRVNREVRIQPDSARRQVRWSVDALVTVGGIVVPVEFKLNRKAEADLPAQLLQYSGPALAMRGTGDHPKPTRFEHPYVALVDNQGVAVFRRGEIVDGPAALTIPRGSFSPPAVARFRQTLLSLLR